MDINLKKEIETRTLDPDTVYAVIGPELKLRRIRLRKTLKYVAYRICSISYVSKLESNYLKPNATYLSEISKRLGMSDVYVSTLFGLREIVEEGIKGLLFNDNKCIKDFILKKDAYYNYRYRIIIFFDKLYDNDFESCTEIFKELTPIAKTMINYDFLVFSILSGIYYYKIGKLKDAHELLISLINFDMNTNLKGVLYLYLFYICNALGRPETIDYYNKAKEVLLFLGSYQMLDETNYYLAIYYIKNNSYDYALNIAKSINDTKRKQTINFLVSYFKNESLKSYNKKNLLGISKIIYDLKFDSVMLKSDIEMVKEKSFKIDYNQIIVDYLLLSDDLKIIYIFDLIKNNQDIQDSYVKSFFLNESLKSAKKTGKYKLIYDYYSFCKGE